MFIVLFKLWKTSHNTDFDCHGYWDGLISALVQLIYNMEIKWKQLNWYTNGEVRTYLILE